jgi:hypothetical protein
MARMRGELGDDFDEEAWEIQHFVATFLLPAVEKDLSLQDGTFPLLSSSLLSLPLSLSSLSSPPLSSPSPSFLFSPYFRSCTGKQAQYSCERQSSPCFACDKIIIISIFSSILFFTSFFLVASFLKRSLQREKRTQTSNTTTGDKTSV